MHRVDMEHNEMMMKLFGAAVLAVFLPKLIPAIMAVVVGMEHIFTAVR